MSRSKHRVYQADDADFDEHGNRVPLPPQDEDEGDWAEGDEWGEREFDTAEDGYGDDEYGPGVTVIRAEKPAAPQTDLEDECYLDPLALVNCWESALLDLKAMHPERFLPPTEAPRSLAQMQAKAPIWYGPPSSAASTSKLPPPPSSTTSSFLPTAFAPPSVTVRPEHLSIDTDQPIEEEEEEDQPLPKKRKRLTGSQKKARKAAKLEAAASAGMSGKGKERAAADEDDGPTYLPDKPAGFEAEEEDLQRLPPGGPSQPPPPSHALPSFPALPPSLSAAPPPPPPHPSSFAFLVPPMGRLPPRGSLAGPPPITPLTGEEPPLEAESPAGLLEAMMWSYYTAGYQTALYHAAIGVAKFKHEADDSSSARKEGGAVA
ncbi:hypothetical protein JCM6882_004824 [Rhodosporidiobolus microsporus]